MRRIRGSAVSRIDEQPARHGRAVVAARSPGACAHC